MLLYLSVLNICKDWLQFYIMKYNLLLQMYI